MLTLARLLCKLALALCFAKSVEGCQSRRRMGFRFRCQLYSKESPIFEPSTLTPWLALCESIACIPVLTLARLLCKLALALCFAKSI